MPYRVVFGRWVFDVQISSDHKERFMNYILTIRWFSWFDSIHHDPKEGSIFEKQP
jgi:hypothetical protein